MRYFKCNDLKPEDRKMIFQDLNLTEEEKKRNRQGKLLNFFAIATDSIVFIVVFFACEFMIAKIPPPQNALLFILGIVGRIILTIGVIVVSILIVALVNALLFEKAQSKLVVKKRIWFDKAIISLREYYGWKEPCIVTKCYDSSDIKFNRRDICIFIVDNELRLTADLKHGFSIKENDLGCYAFKVDDFSLEQIEGEKFPITQLKSGDLVFHLGRRAKSFIEKNFISNKSDT